MTNNFHCAVNNFIEIDKDICAWCSKYKSYITIMNPNKTNSYNINYTAHIKYVSYIIKSNYNNIISLPSFFKGTISRILSENL